MIEFDPRRSWQEEVSEAIEKGINNEPPDDSEIHHTPPSKDGFTPTMVDYRQIYQYEQDQGIVDPQVNIKPEE